MRVTLVFGFILMIISGVILTVFFLITKSTPAAVNQAENFNSLLRGWDSAYKELFFTEREFDYLNSELDRAEERAVTVESWLSVLKRRRALADIHQPSMANYRRSVNNALAAYPASQPVIAVACASVIKNSGINSETEKQLRGWLPLLSDSDYNRLRLAIHVILGDFASPARASVIPDDLLAGEPEREIPGARAVNIDTAIIKITRMNFADASADINNLISVPSYDALRLAAEFHYDFSELPRSAQLFSYLSVYTPNEEESRALTDFQEARDSAMLRQADALYLAGYSEMAAAIWKMLAENSDYQKTVSLYNLSAVSVDQNAAAGYLERLVNTVKSEEQDAGFWGLIRYSRLLNYAQALSVLQENPFFPREEYPYIDLEICKRYSQGQIPGRQLAETWFLLDRHEKNEDLYKWAAWHINFHRNFDEARILLNRLEQLEFSNSWIEMYKTIQLMRDGDLERAENILRSIPAKDWLVYANLGLVLETTRTYSRAIEHYEAAVSNIENLKTAARIQFCAARCYIALNRPNEARHALVTAAGFDPENISIRLELDRFYQ